MLGICRIGDDVAKKLETIRVNKFDQAAKYFQIRDVVHQPLCRYKDNAVYSKHAWHH